MGKLPKTRKECMELLKKMKGSKMYSKRQIKMFKDYMNKLPVEDGKK